MAFAARSFSDGLAAVRGQTRTGFINKSGRIAIGFKYDRAGDFSDGLAAIAEVARQPSPYVPRSINLRWGYIDKQGVTVVAPKYLAARKFSENRALIAVVDKVEAAAKGFAATREGNIFSGARWGFINEKGEIAIAPTFTTEPSSFSEGLAVVSIDGLAGYIDRDGNNVLPPRYNAARPFQDDLAAVRVLTDFGYRWGFIDKKGEWVIEAHFFETHGFSSGVAAVEVNGAWGCIDKRGEFVVEPKYFQLDAPAGQLMWFRKFDWSSIGYVNASGEEVWSQRDQIPRKLLPIDDLVGYPLERLSREFGDPTSVGPFDATFVSAALSEGDVLRVRQYISQEQFSNGVQAMIFRTKEGIPILCFLLKVDEQWTVFANRRIGR